MPFNFRYRCNNAECAVEMDAPGGQLHKCEICGTGMAQIGKAEDLPEDATEIVEAADRFVRSLRRGLNYYP